MSIGPRKLDGLIRDWANVIIKDIEHGGHSSETITYKLMQCGVIISSGTNRCPRYWPNSSYILINKSMLRLKDSYMIYFLSRYVIGIDNKAKLARECGVSRRTMFDWCAGGGPYKKLLILINNCKSVSA